jgi:hypothetical protein
MLGNGHFTFFGIFDFFFCLYVSIPVCYIHVWYFIKTFNTHILSSKIQVPLFWLPVSVLKYHLQAILNLCQQE